MPQYTGTTKYRMIFVPVRSLLLNKMKYDDTVLNSQKISSDGVTDDVCVLSWLRSEDLRFSSKRTKLTPKKIVRSK
jgi:hypothetical protein